LISILSKIRPQANSGQSVQSLSLFLTLSEVLGRVNRASPLFVDLERQFDPVAAVKPLNTTLHVFGTANATSVFHNETQDWEKIMDCLTKAQKHLCLLLILSMFFMGCSSVNARSSAMVGGSTTMALHGEAAFADQAEKVGAVDTFITVLLVISVVGLLVLLADSDRKSQGRHRRAHNHRYHSHHHAYCDCH
jgi:hypothetical protein